METLKLLEEIQKEGTLTSIMTNPKYSIHLFEGSPTALVKNHRQKSYKLILIEELLENLEEFKKSSNGRKIKRKHTFLEKGTRLTTNSIKVIEKQPKKFKIKLLAKNNRKIKEKNFLVPKRLWVLKLLKKGILPQLFFIEEWKEEKTVLYTPPFPNTYQDGTICWGASGKGKYKKDITADYLDKEYFENSIFTHDNNFMAYEDKEKNKTYTATQFISTFSSVKEIKNLNRAGTLSDFLD